FIMYTEFYGLNEKPFNLTPSPRFLYLSEGHKEALALLRYGVVERQGFILLTGEVGTGKTTMVRALLDSLDETVKYVHLSNPLLSPKEFINYLALSTFRQKGRFRSKTEFLLFFQAYLKQAFKNRTNFNLIIDEAHKLSFELLEEIRLLSNIETDDEKLINIFLVGQPELNRKLSEPICRPLLQRISIRHHITPLSLEETRDYMETRLRVAGAKNRDLIFPRDTTETIYRFSNGYPREINVLSDNALLLGYAKGRKKITPSMVEECYQDLRIEGESKSQDPLKIDVKDGNESAKESKGMGKWKWALVLLLSLVFIASILSPPGTRIFSHLAAAIRAPYKTSRDMANSQPAEAENGVNGAIEAVVPKLDPEDLQESTYGGASPKDPEKVKIEDVPAIERSIRDNLVEDHPEFNGTVTRLRTPPKESEDLPEKTMIVKEGDTLTLLALSVYGRADKNILDLVHRSNPDIDD
ncbi:MAG: AAA family ATPase, partial [Kosmotogaceae bacterium]|nr:AAA family ATPase [Kosmotogaceae bacterium]